VADAAVSSLALWEEGIDDPERARRMVATWKLISELQTEKDRRSYDLFNLRLYGKNNDLTLYDHFAAQFVDTGKINTPAIENSKNNRAKAAIDTLASQVASTDVRARAEVVDGDYKVRRRARKLQVFADGLADELQFSRVKRRAWMDASVFDSAAGVVQLFRSGNRVAAQRVLPTELAIDPSDGFVDGVPRTIYRCRPVPRANVHADFGSTKRSKDAIDAVKAVVGASATPIDQILVYESWTLPTGPDENDGYHLVAVDGIDGDLVVEKYEKPHHELVFLKIEDRFTGAWGNSPMTQVRDLQIRINANDYRVERNTKIFSAQHLYVDRSTNLEKSKLSNEIGTAWEGTGPNPPQQIKFQCAPKELYEQIERDGQRIFEDLGVNLQSSQGATEAGLDASGAARREAKKSLDGRNSIRQQRYEDFHLDLLRVALSIARDIANEPEDEVAKARAKKTAKQRGYTVKGRENRRLTSIDFNDIAIDEADYKLTTKPASIVPTTPEGLIAFGQDMMDLGIWTADVFAEYWQDLDADGRTNALVAKRRNLENKFDRALYDGAPLAPPDEFTNYKLAMEVGLQFLDQGEEDGVPDKSLEKLRRYLRQVKRLDAAVNAPPPAPAPVPTPAPAAAAA
jgi:hypothetical protein